MSTYRFYHFKFRFSLTEIPVTLSPMMSEWHPLHPTSIRFGGNAGVLLYRQIFFRR